MGLGAVLDTVLSFVLVMLILSLAVQTLMELIKRFFATKAKTMEALLSAMGEYAIRDALVAMKTPPQPTAKTREAAEAERIAREKAQSVRQDSAPDISGTVEDAKKAAQEASDKRQAVGKESNERLKRFTRGRSNLTPQALKAELLRNAIAAAQEVRSQFSRRVELWDTAFQATALLAKNPDAYTQRVGVNCVLTLDNLKTLDALPAENLGKILEYKPSESPDDLINKPAEMLKRFSQAAQDNDFLSGLSWVQTDPPVDPSVQPPLPRETPEQRKARLQAALSNLSALTPSQAQALFAEYVLPVREEVEDMLGNVKFAAEKFGKMLPRDVRERLYDVGRDANQAQQAVEDWYNSWMAQFSAVYEAKLKVWAFWVGLFVVVAVNANAVNIYQSISRSSALRTSLTKSEDVKQIIGSLKTQSTKTDELKFKDIQEYQATIDQIYQLDIVGWKLPPKTNFWNWAGSKIMLLRTSPGTVLTHLIGWLLTAVLIGLGAPFWNDLFDSLVAVKNPKNSRPADGAAT